MLKTSLMAIVLALASVAGLQANEGPWFTDYAKAKAAAEEQQKPMLLDFTGSDWCGWCMKLDKEIFATPAFKDYARKSLILVKLDFPQNKTLPKAEKEQNAALAAQYKVQGYPTLLLLSPDEKTLFVQNGYEQGGVKALIEKLDAAVKK